MFYRVRLDYTDFMFDDAEEAMTFAQTAFQKKTVDPNDRDFSVEIKLIKIKED